MNGLQVDDVSSIECRFDELGYFYQNETDNKAYQYFVNYLFYSKAYL
jgi:threonine dehydratase